MLERRRYRKISIRVWGDERFNRLSKPQPNAQTLWFYLLTGPHTSALPGLFVSGEASLAEALEWPLKAFRRCFCELTSESMALADWEHRVVWLPKAVNHNAPESPNVVKGWATALDEIPECHLKAVAAESLKAFIEGMGEGFQKALAKGWPKTLSSIPVNQEQEQIQEQEQEQTSAVPAVLGDFDAFWSVYPKRKAKGDAEKAWKAIKDRPPLETILSAVRIQAQSRDWRKDGGQFIPYPATWIRARRWEDEGGPRRPIELVNDLGEDWFSECQRLHGGACNGRYGHSVQMGIDEERARAV